MYNDRFEVVHYVIESSRRMIIGVKFEVHVKKCDISSYFCYDKSLAYISEISLAKFGFLIDIA